MILLSCILPADDDLLLFSTILEVRLSGLLVSMDLLASCLLICGYDVNYFSYFQDGIFDRSSVTSVYLWAISRRSATS